MFALLIKPAAMRKRAHRQLVAQLKNDGAVQLKSHSASELRVEISDLLKVNSNVTVVACGGDGTVNLAVNALVDLPVNFAVLPMGTGNDFARHIGVAKLNVAVKTLTDGDVILSDLGLIELKSNQTHLFTAVASCGFDAQVNERANLIQGPNGPVKYLLSVFGELKNLKPLSLTLNYNNKSDSGEYSLIAIGNTSSYGGGMYITPSADLTDGLFSCTIVNSVSRTELVKVLPRVFNGSHVFHPAVAVEQTNEIEIGGENYPIYADGERIGLGPAKFKVLPARLRLLVPNNI